MVFLHNPERTLADLPTDEGRDRLSGACAYLAEAVASNLCAAWGISSWNPDPLVDVLAASTPDHLPTVLLVRAGLTVPDSVAVGVLVIAEPGARPRQLSPTSLGAKARCQLGDQLVSFRDFR